MTSQTAYHLVTTADERTWKFDRPVLFLGEWCRIYDRKHIWQGMDAIVAAPYGLGQVKKDADHAEARALEDEIFTNLCAVLNRHHGTQHSLRFWRIVLGHWFRRYVDVILNRVRTIEQCLQTHQLSGTTGFVCGSYSLTPMDSQVAIWAFNDDRWNNELYIRILKLLSPANPAIEWIDTDNVNSFRWPNPVSSISPTLKLRNFLLQKIRALLAIFQKNNDSVIIRSYLPKKDQVKLQLLLGQIPQLLSLPQYYSHQKSNPNLRRRLTRQISFEKGNTLHEITTTLLFDLLPICYLEAFSEMIDNVEKLPWPNRPKFIFTSNCFDRDELFKLWLANKVESGFQYFAGQHGNNYGTYRYMHPSVEEMTADKFLTWGWTDGMQQHSPTFILKTAGRKKQRYDPAGGLLLIELCLSHRLTTWDDTYEFANYYQEQRRFIDELDTTVKENLTIRLHGGYKQQRWAELNRWRDFNADLKIDTGAMVIEKLISHSRLIVHSYDSTGILETLSQNIPTLAFWQNNLDHLRNSAKPYYQLLMDVGIVHLSPDSAAAKANEIWDDVEGWWGQNVVQDAIKIFCNRYAKRIESPVRKLKEIMLSGSIANRL
jgi:putative transferase (TIGR04331 family)